MILGLHHAQITIPKDAEELGRKFYKAAENTLDFSRERFNVYY